MERDEVIASGRRRNAFFTDLKGQIELSKSTLHPRSIGARFLQNQKQILLARRENTSEFLRDNAKWIAAGGLLSLLIAARSPILKLIKRPRKKYLNSSESQSEL